MSLSKTGAMQYEDIPLKPSKRIGAKVARREIAAQLDKISTSVIVWHLVKRHKFGLLLTAFAVYVAFTTLGTLIVGLLESL